MRKQKRVGAVRDPLDSPPTSALNASSGRLVPSVVSRRTSARKNGGRCRFQPTSFDVQVEATSPNHKEIDMRFMVLVPGSPESEAGVMPSTEALGEMTKYNEELARAGVMLAGEGLHPTSRGAKVRFDGSQRTVIDGPFTEAKELVAGYWVWECASREEAIEWLKRAPFDGGVEIELRQIFEAEDFGEQLTPELREANERLREQAAQN
jgi:hypothetical protein